MSDAYFNKSQNQLDLQQSPNQDAPTMNNFDQLPLMGDLRSVGEILPKYRRIFSNYHYFNKIQSQVLDVVLYSDDSLVVSAPTGSGKTVFFELAIVRLLINAENLRLGDENKTVYIAPMKALCEERLLDWQQKFAPLGLNCISVTGDSENIDMQVLSNYNLIMTTPEKWDSLTRRWKDNTEFITKIKLVLIDEVHLLNEDQRGSTLEVIICRMKTIQSLIRDCGNVINMRYVAVSATIANPEDIAEWLTTSMVPARSFKFGDEMRPVELKKVVMGYDNNRPGTTPFKFDMCLTYKLQSIIMQYAEGKPTLIFCSMRKSVEMTASHLIRNLTINMHPSQKQIIQGAAAKISDSKIKEALQYGVGYHHAGVSPDDRRTIEDLFRSANLPILVTTSTLAMGVNLPAHLVIVKSTTYYANGELKHCTESMIQQMIGRAGRPQFDSSATAVILTSTDSKFKYENMIAGGQPIESSLHNSLTEHLNAEVVLQTITDLGIAMQWLTSTYLYIRARKNPKYYKITPGMSFDQIDKKLLNMCQVEINRLARYGMLTIDENVMITPTITGSLMAKYCIAFETMKLFTEVTGKEILQQVLGVISKCQDFYEIVLRVSDKSVLNTLNGSKKTPTIRFPFNGKIRSTDMKINCIIQAIFGCLTISSPALETESLKIMRVGERVCKCLREYLEIRGNCYLALLSTTILLKCFRARLWENSAYVCKQLAGIGSAYSSALVNAGKVSFKDVLEANPRDLERIIKRNPPFGNNIQDQVAHLPSYEMNITRSVGNDITLTVTINLKNAELVRQYSSVNKSSMMVLIVGDENNNMFIYEKFAHRQLISNPTIERKLNFPATYADDLSVNFISEDWVGFDCKYYLKTRSSETTNEKANANKIQHKKRNNKSSHTQTRNNKTSHIQTFMDNYFKGMKKVKRKSSKASLTRKNTGLGPENTNKGGTSFQTSTESEENQLPRELSSSRVESRKIASSGQIKIPPKSREIVKNKVKEENNEENLPNRDLLQIECQQAFENYEDDEFWIEEFAKQETEKSENLIPVGKEECPDRKHSSANLSQYSSVLEMCPKENLKDRRCSNNILKENSPGNGTLARKYSSNGYSSNHILGQNSSCNVVLDRKYSSSGYSGNHILGQNTSDNVALDRKYSSSGYSGNHILGQNSSSNVALDRKYSSSGYSRNHILGQNTSGNVALDRKYSSSGYSGNHILGQNTSGNVALDRKYSSSGYSGNHMLGQNTSGNVALDRRYSSSGYSGNHILGQNTSGNVALDRKYSSSGYSGNHILGQNTSGNVALDRKYSSSGYSGNHMLGQNTSGNVALDRRYSSSGYSGNHILGQNTSGNVALDRKYSSSGYSGNHMLGQNTSGNVALDRKYSSSGYSGNHILGQNSSGNVALDRKYSSSGYSGNHILGQNSSGNVALNRKYSSNRYSHNDIPEQNTSDNVDLERKCNRVLDENAAEKGKSQSSMLQKIVEESIQEYQAQKPLIPSSSGSQCFNLPEFLNEEISNVDVSLINGSHAKAKRQLQSYNPPRLALSYLQNQPKEYRLKNKMNYNVNFEDSLYASPLKKGDILPRFSHTPSKKCTHTVTSQQSAIAEKPYVITEIHKPECTTPKVDQKTISWRSPLVFSPVNKYSPNLRVQANISLCSENKSKLTVSPGNDSMESGGIQRPTLRENLLKKRNALPLSDEAYSSFAKQSQDSRPLQVEDILSSTLMENLGLPKKEPYPTPRKKPKEEENITIASYYSQLASSPNQDVKTPQTPKTPQKAKEEQENSFDVTFWNTSTVSKDKDDTSFNRAPSPGLNDGLFKNAPRENFYPRKSFTQPPILPRESYPAEFSDLKQLEVFPTRVSRSKESALYSNEFHRPRMCSQDNFDFAPRMFPQANTYNFNYERSHVHPYSYRDFPPMESTNQPTPTWDFQDPYTFYYERRQVPGIPPGNYPYAEVSRRRYSEYYDPSYQRFSEPEDKEFLMRRYLAAMGRDRANEMNEPFERRTDFPSSSRRHGRNRFDETLESYEKFLDFDFK